MAPELGPGALRCTRAGRLAEVGAHGGRGASRAAPPDPLVLREREYRLLFSGQAVSLLGDGMVPAALAFAVIVWGA